MILPRDEEKLIASLSPGIVIFDIDGTCFDYERRIDSTHRVYKSALKNGNKIVFLTARIETPQDLEITKRELIHHDYAKYDKLILLPEQVACTIMRSARNNGSAMPHVANWKASQREILAKQAPIVATLEDTIANLSGNHTGIPVLIDASPPLKLW